jgi:hypothetical protein
VAELSGEPGTSGSAATLACCPPEQQTSCCDAAAKSDCCDAHRRSEDSCACRAVGPVLDQDAMRAQRLAD